MFSETDFENELPDSNQERRLLRYYSAIRQAINQSHIRPVNIPDEPHLCLDYVARGMGLVMAQQKCKATFLLYPAVGQSALPECISLSIRGPYGTMGVASIPAFKKKTTKFIPKCRSPQLDDTIPKSLFSSAHNSLLRRLSSIDFVGHVLTDTRPTDLPQECMNTIPVNFIVTPEFAKVTYIPENAGIHELSLISKSSHIPGSPFVIVADEFTSDANFSQDPLIFGTPKKHRKIIRKKVIRRIVDFVTEKMILTNDGKLEKITEDFANTPDKIHEDVLTKATSCPDLSVESNISHIPNKSRQADDRIERLVGVCNQLLNNSTRSKSVDILTASQHIFDGRPINIGVCNDHVVKELLLLITPPNSNTPTERFNFSISSEESVSSPETSPKYDNVMKTTDILSAKMSAMKIREQFNKKHPTFHCLVKQSSDEIIELSEYDKPADEEHVLINDKNEAIIHEIVKDDKKLSTNCENNKYSILYNKLTLNEHEKNTIERPTSPLHKLGKEFSVEFINNNSEQGCKDSNGYALERDASIETLLNSVLSSNYNMISAAPELDMDSIISAENLEEALQKYDAKIRSISVENKSNTTNDNQLDIIENNESPSKEVVDILGLNEYDEELEQAEDGRLDDYQILEEENYIFEDNAVLQNNFGPERNYSTDSAYLSIDDVNSSPESNPNISPMNHIDKNVKKLESIPEIDTENISSVISNQWSRFQQETYESNDHELNCEFMGPAEREIWGLGSNDKKRSSEDGFGSLFTMEWTKTPEIISSFVRVLSEDTVTMDSIPEETEISSLEMKDNEILIKNTALNEFSCEGNEIDGLDSTADQVKRSSSDIINKELLMKKVSLKKSSGENILSDKIVSVAEETEICSSEINDKEICVEELILNKSSCKELELNTVDLATKQININSTEIENKHYFEALTQRKANSMVTLSENTEDDKVLNKDICTNILCCEEKNILSKTQNNESSRSITDISDYIDLQSKIDYPELSNQNSVNSEDSNDHLYKEIPLTLLTKNELYSENIKNDNKQTILDHIQGNVAEYDQVEVISNNNLIDNIVLLTESNNINNNENDDSGNHEHISPDFVCKTDDVNEIEHLSNDFMDSSILGDLTDIAETITDNKANDIISEVNENIRDSNTDIKVDNYEIINKDNKSNNFKNLVDILDKDDNVVNINNSSCKNINSTSQGLHNNKLEENNQIIQSENVKAKISPKKSKYDIEINKSEDVIQKEDYVKSMFSLDLTKHIDTGIAIELNTPSGSQYKPETNDIDFIKLKLNAPFDTLSDEQRSPTPSTAITEELLEDYNENYPENSLEHISASQKPGEKLTSTVHILVHSPSLDSEDSSNNSELFNTTNIETENENKNNNLDNYELPIYTLNKITTNDENGKTVTLINISKEQLDVAEEIQIRTNSVCNINQEFEYDSKNENINSDCHISYPDVDTSSQYDSEQERFAVPMRVSHRKQYWDNKLSGRNESSSAARAITAKRLNNSHTAFLRRSDSLTRKKTRTQPTRCPGTVYKWKQSFESQPHGDNVTSKVEKARKSNSFVNKWKRYWNDVVDKKSDKSVSIHTLDREYCDGELFGIVANGLQKFDTSPRRCERWRRDLHNTIRNDKSCNQSISQCQFKNYNLDDSEYDVKCLSNPDELLKLSKQIYYPENIFYNNVYHHNSSESMEKDKEMNTQNKFEETSNPIVHECQEILEKRNYYWGCDLEVKEKITNVNDTQSEVNQLKVEINNTFLPKKRNNTLLNNCVQEHNLNNVNLLNNQHEREETKYDLKNINTSAPLEVKPSAICESQTQFQTKLLELQDPRITNICNKSVRLTESMVSSMPSMASMTPNESRLPCTTNSKHFNQTGERPGIYPNKFNQHHNTAENIGVGNAGNMDNISSATLLEMQHTSEGYDEGAPLIIPTDPCTKPAVRPPITTFTARENEIVQQERAVTNQINQQPFKLENGHPENTNHQENDESECDSEDQTCKSKARFKKAKQFFQTLEEVNVNEQIKNLNECERLLYSTLRPYNKNKFMTQRNSISTITTNITDRSIKTRSLPASHCQTPDYSSLTSEDSQKTNISERFFVQDLYRDVIGHDDASSAGSFKGIPHKQAVLAALNSMEKKSKYNNAVEHFSQEPDNIFSLTQAYHGGYPYLTTTAPDKFRPRSVGANFDLIPRRVLIYNPSTDNSNL